MSSVCDMLALPLPCLSGGYVDKKLQSGGASRATRTSRRSKPVQAMITRDRRGERSIRCEEMRYNVTSSALRGTSSFKILDAVCSQGCEERSLTESCGLSRGLFRACGRTMLASRALGPRRKDGRCLSHLAKSTCVLALKVIVQGRGWASHKVHNLREAARSDVKYAVPGCLDAVVVVLVLYIILHGGGRAQS